MFGSKRTDDDRCRLMNQILNFDDTQAARLGEFLSAVQRPEGTMSYCECAGFLFTVACTPEMIPPSGWMSIIFNEQDAVYESIEEAQGILQSLTALYNELNRQVQESDVHLPPACNPRGNPMDNLEADAPLSQWSKGFMAGYGWLEEFWDKYTPEELSEEMGAQLMVLSFFTSRKLAQAYLDEGERKDKSLENMAAQMLD